MRRVALCLLLSVLLAVLAGLSAAAGDVREVWRLGGFNAPNEASVDPTDGSCWVSDSYNDQVVHVAKSGTEIWRGGAFDEPVSVSVNPTDGSCWVSDLWNGEVVHLAADGTELWRGGGFWRPTSLSVDPNDGSCWVPVYDNGQVVHLAEDGTELWRGSNFDHTAACAVNPNDGSCWVTDGGNDQVVHLASDGTELWRGGGFKWPQGISVNPTDNSVWIADNSNHEAVHLASDGTELSRTGGFGYPARVSVNPADGSCWVASGATSEVVHLAEDGTELWRGSSFVQPSGVAVDPKDGSCWVTDYSTGQVILLEVHPPIQDLLAFESDRSGNLDIWIMRADGSDLTRVTADAAEDRDPDWSPDGRLIAFSSDRSGNADIWVVHPTSGVLWQITQDAGADTSPTWSPDGARIAFVSDRGTTGEVWVVDVSDLSAPGPPVKLTTYDPGVVDLEGELSPDWCSNGYIAYQTERGHSSVWSIWATNPDDPGDEYEVVPYLGGAGAYYPAWSPDGFDLAYSNLQSGSPSLHNDDLFVLVDAKTPTGGASTAVTDDSAIGNTGVADYHPAWSTRGDRLYFSRMDYGTGAHDVFIVYRDGLAILNLTARPDGVDRHPSVTGTPTCLQVLIDIKPGSNVNPINMKAEGVVAVAIFSTVSFDATQIDPDTLALAGASVAHDAGQGTHSEDVDEDGIVDLVVHFLTQELDEAQLSQGYAVLSGFLTGGACLEGWDVVSLVPHKDVPNEHWAIDGIAALADADIAHGYADGYYRPDLVVTRAAMAVFVSRAAAGGESGVPAGPEAPTFPDVPADHWAYKHVEYAAANDIVQGYGDGTYQPSWHVTRGQMAVYIARAIVDPIGDDTLGAYVPPPVASFPDVPTDYWSYRHVEYLVQQDVVAGYPDGFYRPTALVTRAQMSIYIGRAYMLLD